MLRAMGQKKNNRNAQLQIQLIGFETKSVLSFSKSLHKKNVFRTFWPYLEGDAVGSTKGCARVCYYKMQCVTEVIQKLGHHASNLCFVGERKSDHGCFALG